MFTQKKRIKVKKKNWNILRMSHLELKIVIKIVDITYMSWIYTHSSLVYEMNWNENIDQGSSQNVVQF